MTLVNADTGEIVTECTPDEAREMTERMRSHRDNLWRLAVESHDRRAWAALGYASWRDYIEAEVGVKSSQAYRLLDHGRTMLALAPGESLDSPIGELPTHESQTRPLSRLPETERADAWTEAVEEAATEGRTPTAKDVEAAVERRRPKTTTTERESRSTTTTTEPAPAAAGEEGEGLSRQRQVKPDPSEPDDADAINDAFDRHVDPSAEYRKRFTDAVSKAHDVVQFDVSRALDTAGDSADGHRQLVKALRDWCDRYMQAAGRPDHLRSVQ